MSFGELWNTPIYTLGIFALSLVICGNLLNLTNSQFVKAYDNEDNIYQNSLLREILEKDEANAQLILILSLTGGFILISGIVAYQVNKKQVKKTNSDVDIDQIKID